MATLVVKQKFINVTFKVTTAGERKRIAIPIPPNAVAIVGFSIIGLPGQATFKNDVRRYGSAVTGQNSEVFILTLLREFLQESPTYFEASADVGEKVYYAQPKRLGIPTFEYGGNIGGFLAPITVSVEDSGIREDWYLWESTVENLSNVEIYVNQPD